MAFETESNMLLTRFDGFNIPNATFRISNKNPKHDFLSKQIFFTGPFDQPSITTIKLTNPTDSTQLFKIKTTAPKKYCVRPNVGAVKPNSSTLIDSKFAVFEELKSFNKTWFLLQFVYNQNLWSPMRRTDISSWYKVSHYQMALKLQILLRWWVSCGSF